MSGQLVFSQVTDHIPMYTFYIMGLVHVEFERRFTLQRAGDFSSYAAYPTPGTNTTIPTG